MAAAGDEQCPVALVDHLLLDAIGELLVGLVLHAPDVVGIRDALDTGEVDRRVGQDDADTLIGRERHVDVVEGSEELLVHRGVPERTARRTPDLTQLVVGDVRAIEQVRVRRRLLERISELHHDVVDEAGEARLTQQGVDDVVLLLQPVAVSEPNQRVLAEEVQDRRKCWLRHELRGRGRARLRYARRSRGPGRGRRRRARRFGRGRSRAAAPWRR